MLAALIAPLALGSRRMTVAVIALSLILSSAQSASPLRATDLISESGIAGLRLGMTLDEARKALPTFKFSRTSDGDGAALVEVTRAPGESLTLWADEDDPQSPIDWSKRIQRIETFSAVFHTAEGVHPGSLVTDVERVFGKTKEIVESEIESRQYIQFENQPPYLTFRLDYSGVFPDGMRRTTRFKPGSTLLSIAVSSSR